MNEAKNILLNQILGSTPSYNDFRAEADELGAIDAIQKADEFPLVDHIMFSRKNLAADLLLLNKQCNYSNGFIPAAKQATVQEIKNKIHKLLVEIAQYKKELEDARINAERFETSRKDNFFIMKISVATALGGALIGYVPGCIKAEKATNQVIKKDMELQQIKKQYDIPNSPGTEIKN